eukprot:6887113-Pyramimonas_sp.AAC.1
MAIDNDIACDMAGVKIQHGLGATTQGNVMTNMPFLQIMSQRERTKEGETRRKERWKKEEDRGDSMRRQT